MNDAFRRSAAAGALAGGAALSLVALSVACGTSSGSGVGPGSSTASGSQGSGGSSGSSAGGRGSSGGATASSTPGGSASGSASGSSSSGSGFSTPDGGFGSSGDGGACSSSLASRVRITEIDVGGAYAYNEVDNNGAALGLTPLAISPLPGGGSRIAYLGSGDGMVHVATLDANDALVAGSAFALPAYDFQDLYADARGGVLLVSRSALGSTANNNCGDITHLCGLVANYPTAAACFDLYMVRFDGTSETWATKLTDTTATVPAYGTDANTGGNVIFIWSEYAHNGRIAFDGTNYGAYFGAAITVPGQSCVGQSTMTTGVNIHQGDRMKVVGPTGTVQTGGFSFGCSHSGYERILWDSRSGKYVTVCKNDLADGTASGRLALAPNFNAAASVIAPLDLSYSDFGSVLAAGGGGYWAISSDIRAGQTANMNGLADTHLFHFTTPTATADKNLTLVSDAENDRAPHLAAYGAGQMVAAWEESTALGDLAQNDKNRKMFVQILDSTTGAAPAGSDATTAGPLNVAVLGSRYQDFRAFPDGSVAYPAPGSTNTKLKILRILSCSP